MRIPVDWLNEYVPNGLSVKELAFILTNVGLEVEAIEEAGATAVFGIKVTPNRGDCLSVLGVARELAMKLRVELPECEPRVTETGPPDGSFVRVTLDDPAGCPRYSARVVQGVKIGPSPEWAQRRLELCGLRPISNVVDATNLVMLELGQPLHAFDYQLLRRSRLKPAVPGEADTPEIIVRRARAGERLVTIDGEERELTSEILLITDPSGPIALAGIMGGSSTEIHSGTTEVLLESAHFHPGTIRRGARALGMSTEASYRFERTVDPGGTVRALDRACELMAEFAERPVEIATGVVDAYPNPVRERKIALRPARVNALLGLHLSAAEIAAHLRWLKLDVKEDKPLVVRAPTFRQDLVEEIDLVEEVARVHGYEDIPETLPRGSAGVGGLPPALAFERDVRHLMRGMGLTETVTSSLESTEGHERLKLPEDDARRRAVVISNWKTADRTQLRTTLVTSLLDVVALNRRHGVADVGAFDMGRVYLPAAPDELPDQPQHLAIAVTGEMTRGRWAVPQALARWDFFALKGVVENLLEAMTRREGDFAPEAQPWLQPGRAARVSLGGVAVGYMGEVCGEVREAYDLPDPVFVAELDMDALRAQAAEETLFEPISRFPAVTRDVAFLLPRDVAAERAGRVIEEAAGDDAESVGLFDAFEGKPLPAGMRNLAYSLLFRRADRTLMDEQVEAAMERIRRALREKLGAQIRE
jgi:phenylalanyl-tRNA synthetase beta chain